MYVKTHEEHLMFLRGLVEIQLVYIKNLMELKPSLNFIKVLEKRTMIINLTSLNESHLNYKLIRRVDLRLELFEKMHKSYLEGPEDFIEECLEMLLPYIQQRLLLDLDVFEEMQISKDYFLYMGRIFPENPFIYNLSKIDDQGFIDLHIANNKFPDKFLDDDTFYKNKLIEVVKEAIVSKAKGFKSTTWLNANTNWLRLFPANWKQNEIIKNVTEIETDGFEFWGQFISNNFNVHESNVEYFLSSGRPKYLLTQCHCTIEELIDHLAINM